MSFVLKPTVGIQAAWYPHFSFWAEAQRRGIWAGWLEIGSLKVSVSLSIRGLTLSADFHTDLTSTLVPISGPKTHQETIPFSLLADGLSLHCLTVGTIAFLESFSLSVR